MWVLVHFSSHLFWYGIRRRWFPQTQTGICLSLWDISWHSTWWLFPRKRMWGFLYCPPEFHPKFLSASPTFISWIPFPSASPLCSHGELNGNKISTTICGFLLEFSENCLYFLARGLFGEAFLICMPSSCSRVKLMHKTQHVFLPTSEVVNKWVTTDTQTYYPCPSWIRRFTRHEWKSTSGESQLCFGSE